MKRWMKLTIGGVAALTAGLLAPSAFSVVTTSPRDAIYPIPSIVCGCGFHEYLMFAKDRGLWWNAGHNKKDEYYYTQSNPSGDLELYDWEHKHVGSVRFRWLSIEMQMDDHPQVKVKLYRQLNWIRLNSEKRQGSGEEFRYETLEQKTEKIAEFRKKKEAEKNEK